MAARDLSKRHVPHFPSLRGGGVESSTHPDVKEYRVELSRLGELMNAEGTTIEQEFIDRLMKCRV